MEAGSIDKQHCSTPRHSSGGICERETSRCDRFDERLNVLQCLQLQFALMPLWMLNSKRRLMWVFANSRRIYVALSVHYYMDMLRRIFAGGNAGIAELNPPAAGSISYTTPSPERVQFSKIDSGFRLISISDEIWSKTRQLSN